MVFFVFPIPLFTSLSTVDRAPSSYQLIKLLLLPALKSKKPLKLKHVHLVLLFCKSRINQSRMVKGDLIAALACPQSNLSKERSYTTYKVKTICILEFRKQGFVNENSWINRCSQRKNVIWLPKEKEWLNIFFVHRTWPTSRWP